MARAPWASLATSFSEPLDPAAALEAAGCDWTVSKRQLHRHSNDGELIPVNDCFSITRDDNDRDLGVVGKSFRPVQNRDQIQLLEGVVGAGCKLDTICSLHGGKKVFALCKLADCYEVLPGDVIEPYLLSVNGHDGHFRWKTCFTSIRPVCSNSLTRALKAGVRTLSIRHTTSLEQSISQAKEHLMHVKKAVEKEAEQARALVAKNLSSWKLAEFYADFANRLELGQESKEAVLEELGMLSHSPTNTVRGMEGTAWQAYNVLSEWVDHGSRKASIDNRVESVLMGDGNRMKLEAWDALLSA
jgi:phage/plasmid-like protein (TIGR03299 family)